jgi:hypothetical protein
MRLPLLHFEFGSFGETRHDAATTLPADRVAEVTVWRFCQSKPMSAMPKSNGIKMSVEIANSIAEAPRSFDWQFLSRKRKGSIFGLASIFIPCNIGSPPAILEVGFRFCSK